MRAAQELDRKVAEIIRMGPNAVGHAITMLRLGPGGLGDYAKLLDTKAKITRSTFSVSIGGCGSSAKWILQVENKGELVFQSRSSNLHDLGLKLDEFLGRLRLSRVRD